jgi:hypothetical protein
MREKMNSRHPGCRIRGPYLLSYKSLKHRLVSHLDFRTAWPDSSRSGYKSAKAAPISTSRAPNAFIFAIAESPAVPVPFVPVELSASLAIVLAASLLD